MFSAWNVETFDIWLNYLSINYCYCRKRGKRKLTQAVHYKVLRSIKNVVNCYLTSLILCGPG